MSSQKFWFKSEREALLVADYLYGSQVRGRCLIYGPVDLQALEFACQLAGVETPDADPYEHYREVYRGAFYQRYREAHEGIGVRIPRIYVTCPVYSDHGIWISCCKESDEILEEIEWMLSISPLFTENDERKWQLRAYQGWGKITIGHHDFTDLTSLSIIGRDIDIYSEAYQAYGVIFKENPPTLKQLIQIFQGLYPSEASFVIKTLRDSGEMEMIGKSGIDELDINWASVAQRWFDPMDGYFRSYTKGNNCYVFASYYSHLSN